MGGGKRTKSLNQYASSVADAAAQLVAALNDANHGSRKISFTGVRVYDNNDKLAGQQAVSVKRTSVNAALLRFVFPLTEAQAATR